MTALHFEATYRNGTILVPSEYRDLMQQQVEIVVLMKPIAKSKRQTSNFLDRMMDNPKVIPGFVPMTREEAHARD